VRGAHLARDDYIECELDGERLDGGGRSKVTVRIANLLPYTALKIFAFQDRHENKDAYDLVFTLLHAEDGPGAAGEAARSSPVAAKEQVVEALALLDERFRDVEQDGPSAYGLFLAAPDDDGERARLRRERPSPPSASSCRASATSAKRELPGAVHPPAAHCPWTRSGIQSAQAARAPPVAQGGSAHPPRSVERTWYQFESFSARGGV